MIPTDLIETTRISVANTLQRFLCSRRHVSYIERHIGRAFSLSKKFLSDNNDLLVTKADKGQSTVVMNKTDYLLKMESLLSDEFTYKKINKNPTKPLMNKINSLLKSWLNNKLIDERTYKHLNCTNGNLPRCYGLPKTHKPGFPLRIIVSTVGSALYNLSTYIQDILQRSVVKPASHINDGWSFSKKIKDVIIEGGQVMISLDVSSLFTNIPKELVLTAIEKRWNNISSATNFSLAQFIHVVELILDSTSFSFNGQFYEQIFGSPMGSPLSPILADIALQEKEITKKNFLQQQITLSSFQSHFLVLAELKKMT
ncbi:uncharacterized protein [Anoplolepis gracilipes]|uniref:uncharacterized protein n=1 Tax=Anoplolepis gracilipes TaxID=354296 RepID=UPI003BA2B71D